MLEHLKIKNVTDRRIRIIIGRNLLRIRPNKPFNVKLKPKDMQILKDLLNTVYQDQLVILTKSEKKESLKEDE